jgi:hypothetical protein
MVSCGATGTWWVEDKRAAEGEIERGEVVAE